jgi:hypothetical protein
MKFLYILPAFALLAACGPDPIPCMGSVEKGKVIRAQTDTREFCGRGGCTKYVYTYLTIEVNGVSRTCVVDDAVDAMFAPGEVINITTGRRL